MAHAIHTADFGHFVADFIRHKIEAFNAARVARAEYNNTVRELSELGDRELADLGLSRIQIKTIARQHVYGG